MLDRPLRATTSGSAIRIPSIDPTKSLVVDEIMISPASATEATLARFVDGKSKQIIFSAYDLTGVDSDPDGETESER